MTYRLRSEYVEQLVSDIASYYGYNDFLAEKLFQLFPVSEVCALSPYTLSCLCLRQAIEFFEANEVSRPVTIRTNTLKTRRRDLAQALINRGVNLEPIGKWTNVGLQVFESSVPIGLYGFFTPEPCGTKFHDRCNTRVSLWPLYASGSFIIPSRHRIKTSTERAST
jgi:16S rRNA C967 or C1407 C5-methylase (RsmB/RsmF family)